MSWSGMERFYINYQFRVNIVIVYINIRQWDPDVYALCLGTIKTVKSWRYHISFLLQAAN